MTTNVPKPTFGPNGFEVPTETQLLTGVFADLNSAFGGGLNPSLSTPQGQLASSEAAVLGNTNSTFQQMTNLMDPAYSFGRYQDALARIYFLERNPAQPTVVQALCTGLFNTVIPENALAVAEDGNQYRNIQEGTIPIGGSITLAFECVIPGPIACPANSLNQIYQAIPGWDSINNATDGVLGNNEESRTEFEDRRIASVAANSVGTLNSVLGAVLKVSNVLDAYVTDNDTNAPATVGGVTLAANSLYVSVAGGTDDDVARAIWSKKSPGCSYTGTTTVIVQDTNSGYSPPLPSYNVKFNRPNSLPILFAVSLANSAQVPANAVVQIQNAIIAAFAGADGGTRARIGSTIYASRYYAPVAALGSWAEIISLLIGSNNNTGATGTGSITGPVMTITGGVTGVFAVGQTVGDDLGHIAAGTTIVSLGTGTGGTGTYNVNISQTVASETIKATTATRTSLSVNINQVPTISAGNIQVTFV